MSEKEGIARASLPSHLILLPRFSKIECKDVPFWISKRHLSEGSSNPLKAPIKCLFVRSVQFIPNLSLYRPKVICNLSGVLIDPTPNWGCACAKSYRYIWLVKKRRKIIMAWTQIQAIIDTSFIQILRLCWDLLRSTIKNLHILKGFLKGLKGLVYFQFILGK